MDILITAATLFEIAPTVHQLQQNQNKFPQHQIQILVSGVGQAATVYSLSKKIQSYLPQMVIQAGIAGSFIKDLLLGTTVLVQKDCFADLGIEEKNRFFTLFDSGFADKNKFPFTDGWLLNNHPLINAGLFPQVSAVTVNKVSDREIQNQQCLQQFSAHIETMEGAALHFVCLQENIPFIQIRSISNEVGERDKSKWKTNEAIQNLNDCLQNLLQQL